MAGEIIIVVNSENEKEYGQILKDFISATGVYEATLWTKTEYTDSETMISPVKKVVLKMINSVKKVVFIGENDVSEKHLSSINWKFDSPNMRYGWIDSVALISVGDTLFTKKQLEAFKKMAEQQNQDIEELKKNILKVAGGAAAGATVGGVAIATGVTAPLGLLGMVLAAGGTASATAVAAALVLPILAVPVGLAVIGGLVVSSGNKKKMLVKQRKEQYRYLITHFVLHGMDEYMGLKNDKEI